MEKLPLIEPKNKALPEIHVLESADQASEFAAGIITSEAKLNPFSRITYATGDTMIPVYQKIEEITSAGKVDFSRTTAFHLDEYYPYSPDAEYSFVRFLKGLVFDPYKISPANIHTINGLATNPHVEADRYEKTIGEGVDLTILGIGPGGHIGFNERNTPFDSKTHLQVLSDETYHRDAVERGQDTPKTAMTQGISTILRSKKIILVAYGKTKGEILKEALYGEISEKCPASSLRLCPEKVTIIIDREAYKAIES